MFVVNLTYIKPLEEIGRHLEAHREFLNRQYADGVFLASGPKNPRDGGVILASGKVSRTELDAILNLDPFRQHELAIYDVIEFTPAKCVPLLDGIL
ncbi:YciI family protein [Ochrobactrum vermis]|uniref:YciI family protein n=1 Tax=Ochrobactrum vermis TaxID=1827297 RepID=A0ABU8PB15_9HYPH|nr:YciI family protein [Ochrobactrum vermis]PQZ29378.1 GTP cyclohydrolase [Ochrobactrum vermis]